MNQRSRVSKIWFNNEKNKKLCEFFTFAYKWDINKKTFRMFVLQFQKRFVIINIKSSCKLMGRDTYEWLRTWLFYFVLNLLQKSMHNLTFIAQSSSFYTIMWNNWLPLYTSSSIRHHTYRMLVWTYPNTNLMKACIFWCLYI